MSLQVCAPLSGRTDTHNKLSPGVIPFDTPERRQVALTTQEKGSQRSFCASSIVPLSSRFHHDPFHGRFVLPQFPLVSLVELVAVFPTGHSLSRIGIFTRHFLPASVPALTQSFDPTQQFTRFHHS